MTQLQIEKQALSRENNPASKARLGEIETEISELQEKMAGLKAQWESEKNAIKQITDLKAKLEKTKEDAARAEREGDLNRAAELRYGALPRCSASSMPRTRSSPRCRRAAPCSRRRSPTRTSPRSWPSGPACPSRGCSSRRCRSSSGWKSRCRCAWSDRKTRFARYRTRCGAHGPD